MTTSLKESLQDASQLVWQTFAAGAVEVDEATMSAGDYRIVIAGDDLNSVNHIVAIFEEKGINVPQSFVVPLSLVADRASRVAPDIVVVLLTHMDENAYAVLRATRNSSLAYLLAVGPGLDANAVLRGLREGADDFVDLRHLTSELTTALTRYRERLQARSLAASQGQIISVLGACGGAGASTVAVNLAGLLAAQTQSTGLIDLRLLSGDLASLLDLKPQYTVADFCSRIERMDRAMFDQLFTVHPSGVQLLAAPWDALQHHTICAQKVRLLFAMARTKFSHLVLDVDSHLGEIDAEALGQSDLVLIVTRLDFIAVRSARRLLDRLAMLGVPAEAIEVVANRRGQAKELSVAQAERALGSKIRHSLADDPKRAVGAATLGKLVSTTSRWSRLARDFRQLAADVLKMTARRDSPPTQGR